MVTETKEKGAVSRKLEELRRKGWSDLSIGVALGVDRVVVYRWRVNGKEKEAQIVLLALKSLERRKVPAQPCAKSRAGRCGL